jgi:hypothetical protein
MVTQESMLSSKLDIIFHVSVASAAQRDRDVDCFFAAAVRVMLVKVACIGCLTAELAGG